MSEDILFGFGLAELFSQDVEECESQTTDARKGSKESKEDQWKEFLADKEGKYPLIPDFFQKLDYATLKKLRCSNWDILRNHLGEQAQISDSPLIVFDEAGSSLDYASDDELLAEASSEPETTRTSTSAGILPGQDIFVSFHHCPLNMCTEDNGWRCDGTDMDDGCLS